MRKIKFRGKRLDNGEWVYGNLVYKKYESPAPESTDIYTVAYIKGFDLHSETYQVAPETVGQFTGLYDSTGKEIYEGDIIKAKSLDSSLTTVDVIVYVVKYNEKKGTWVFSNNTPLYFVMDFYKIEKIGNIHDNPELIDQ